MTIDYSSGANLVVLITGGFNGSYDNGSHLNSAEIFNPVTNTSCSLPQLPEARRQHSQDGGLVCGGLNSLNTTILDATQKTCVKWSPASGTWIKSLKLRKRRHGHVAWATSSGVYFMGGDGSRRTSEKVNCDGSVEDSFPLKDYTW